ncbi:ankyrin repeat domain-containing protein SOWAHB isoform X3 [Cryptotermes secundus]|uniref:ankyrin repeat domain-containing protein SOWAHB isoform X3 n=1 Tax=Cryptotermes secundus TaxID=105785 RepID=UPI001454D1EE|nr:ankyrin repeat domain-containing protein SOWAHB isoform X3 [Cryptotermes secundus]
MAVPSELTLDAIRDFMLENGGKVTNHDLVKHFKGFLTNPETRVEARNQFKEFVNTLAVIRNEEGEKYLMLKKKYRNPMGEQSPAMHLASPVLPSSSFDSLSSVTSTAMIPSESFSASEESLDMMSPSRQPPPYRSPPPPSVSPVRPSAPCTLLDSSESGIPSPSVRQENEMGREKESLVMVRSVSRDDSLNSSTEITEETVIHAPPPVPPRRKSSDKLKLENKENVHDTTIKRLKMVAAEAGNKMDAPDADSEQKISVKERMQKFNRLAESDMKTHPIANKKKIDRGVDDYDSASVTTLDAKSREWLVFSSQANYQALAKLAAGNPRLARFKDPTSYTALHWAAKHGNDDVVKLIAGTYQADVNARSNGGYTPLHMAMQFGHEEIYNLLVKVYGADPNLRDWSGRKPRQYQASQDTSVSADTFRRLVAAGTLRNQSKEKTCRKRLRLLENWLLECESQEDN